MQSPGPSKAFARFMLLSAGPQRCKESPTILKMYGMGGGAMTPQENWAKATAPGLRIKKAGIDVTMAIRMETQNASKNAPKQKRVAAVRDDFNVKSVWLH